MDPEQTLKDAQMLLDSDNEMCAEFLGEYFDWRLKGGFEPEGGDNKAFDILLKLGELADNASD